MFFQKNCLFVCEGDGFILGPVTVTFARSSQRCHMWGRHRWTGMRSGFETRDHWFRSVESGGCFTFFLLMSLFQTSLFLALKFILWVVFTWKVRLPTLVTLEGSGWSGHKVRRALTQPLPHLQLSVKIAAWPDDPLHFWVFLKLPMFWLRHVVLGLLLRPGSLILRVFLLQGKRTNLRKTGSERIAHGMRVKFNPLALLLDSSLEGEFDLVQRIIYEVWFSFLNSTLYHSLF